MQSSSFLTLEVKDFIKGLVVAIFGAVIATIYEALQTGSDIDFQKIGLVSLTAGCAYLMKNLISDSKGVPLGTADKK